MVSDLENYAYIGFDREEIEEKFGSDIRTHIDMSCQPRSYLSSWKIITVSLSAEEGGITGDKTADIMQFKGKLFLSQKSYDLLSPVLKNDGEFLPVEYEKGRGYIFNPLSLAESVNGLNKVKSEKKGKRDIINMEFYEDRLSNFGVFKTEFDNYISVICNDRVKEIAQNEGLGGVEFSEDLAENFR